MSGRKDLRLSCLHSSGGTDLSATVGTIKARKEPVRPRPLFRLRTALGFFGIRNDPSIHSHFLPSCKLKRERRTEAIPENRCRKRAAGGKTIKEDVVPEVPKRAPQRRAGNTAIVREDSEVQKIPVKDVKTICFAILTHKISCIQNMSRKMLIDPRSGLDSCDRMLGIQNGFFPLAEE